MAKKIETIAELIQALLVKYNPNASIRYLSADALGQHIRIQHHDTCVYICDANSEVRLTNQPDSQVLNGVVVG